jgi:hypothetical protein
MDIQVKNNNSPAADGNAAAFAYADGLGNLLMVTTGGQIVAVSIEAAAAVAGQPAPSSYPAGITVITDADNANFSYLRCSNANFITAQGTSNAVNQADITNIRAWKNPFNGNTASGALAKVSNQSPNPSA